MQKNSQFFADMAKMAGNAAGNLLEFRKEIENMVGDKVEALLGRFNMPSREELEVVREMAAKARLENEKLEARIAELEKSLGKSNL